MTQKRILFGAFGLVIVLVGAVAFAVLRPGGPENAPRSQVPASLQKLLDVVVSTMMTGHGSLQCSESIYGPSCVTHCTASVFAMDPQNATTVGQVTAAYANVACSTVDSADIDDSSINVYAVRMTTPPAFVEAPDDALKSDIAKIFPPYAVNAAWWYYTHPTPSG